MTKMASAESYWEKRLSRKAEGTRREYLRYFRRFLEWSELSPERLYELHKEALESEDLRESDVVGELVGEYMDIMEGEGYSNSTQNMMLKAVKSFFDANRLDFEITDLRRRRISKGSKGIKADQIRTIITYSMGRSNTRLRNRAMCYLLKDSGLRISDCSLMDIEQYNKARDVKHGGVTFKVFDPFETKKTKDLAYTILGPEATEVLDQLIGDRVAGPIFLDTTGKRWSTGAITAHFCRVRDYALKKDGRKISAHSFRKFNMVMLQSAGIPTGWIRTLQGKAKGEYEVPEDMGELEPAYFNAYDKLRIHPHARLDAEVEGLRTELERVQSEKTSQNGEIERLRESMKQIHEINAEVIKGLREIQEEREEEKKAKKREG